MRLPLPWTALALTLLMGACTAAPSGDAAKSADPSAVQPIAAPTTPPPRVEPPTTAPTDAIAQKGASATGQVDYSCSTDADCAVKDVGNCCGYYPACVNADSPTFPEQVKAECTRSGAMSVCGFPDIQGCQCVDNRCQATPAPELQQD